METDCYGDGIRYATLDEAITRVIRDALNGCDDERRYDVPAIAALVLGDYEDGYVCKVSDYEFWLIADRLKIENTPEEVLAANLRYIGLNPGEYLLAALAAHVYQRAQGGYAEVPLVADFGSGSLEMACTDTELAVIAAGYRR